MLSGLAVAYHSSLPAALHFLGAFGVGSVKSLISTDEYFSFVLRYLACFASFQLPLVMLLLNRMTPLSPKTLIKHSRYVIAASFIIAAVITPTPDPVNQTIAVSPIIVLYALRHS